MTVKSLNLSGLESSVSVDGAGPAILFVHGFPLDRSMWVPVSSRLHGRRWIAPDLAGFGESGVPAAGPSLTDHAHHLAAVLDALNIDEAVICGLSMGGYIAFEMLRRHPGRVAGLVLANTKAEADDAAGKAARDDAIGLVEREGTGALVERMVPKLLWENTLRNAPGVVDHVRKMIRGAPARGVVAALAAMRDRADCTDLLGQVTVPALVLAGAHDQLAPRDGMRTMAGSIPGARFVEVPGAGHLTPLEQADLVAAEIRKFLRELS